MTIEDRLFAVAQQYADQRGPAGLTDQADLISQLSSQAPDLHAEVRALAAALSIGAAGRIKAAGNAELEAHAIAAEIAGSQKLAMATVTPAVAVARRLDVAGAVTMPAPADAGWAGDSVVVGAAPHYPAAPAAPVPPGEMPPPPPQTAPVTPTETPIWRNKWAIGGAGAIALLLAYQNFRGPTQLDGAPDPGITTAPTIGPVNPAPGPVPGPFGPNGAPTAGPVTPPAPGPAGGTLPELAQPGAPLPILLVRQQGQGFVVGFSLRGLATMVAAPQAGWDRGPGMIALARNAQSQRPDSFGGGQFQPVASSDGPSRLMRVQWQQDGLGIGAMCVAFVGSGGTDVNPAGSRLCVLDGGCSRAVACGQLPAAGTPAQGSGIQPGQ